MGALHIEKSLFFIYTAYPLLLSMIAYFGFREFSHALKLWKRADWTALAAVALVALLQLLLNADLVNDYWRPGEQNWKFEYNAALISEFDGNLLGHVHHHASSFLISLFFQIFGISHTSAVYLNSVAFVLLCVFIFAASREVFSSWRAGLAAGLFAPFYDPLLALWPAGGEYLLAFSVGTAALWLVMRNLRVGTLSSFITAALVLQLAAMTRMELGLLWGVWFCGACTSACYPRHLFRLLPLTAAAGLLLQSLAFSIFFLSRSAASSMHLWWNADACLLLLSDAAPVLAASIPGFRKALLNGNSAIYGLLSMLFVYSAIVMSSQSSDQYQLSAYLFIPVCIIAGGVALYLPSRLMLFSATLLPVVILNVLPRQYCLWDSLEAEREADRALRRLAATLPDDMPRMLGLAYSRMALGKTPPPHFGAISVDMAISDLAGRGPFACFHRIGEKEGCWFVELFQNEQRAIHGAPPAVEPLNFGCSIIDSHRDDPIEMLIYECPDDAGMRKAVSR